jgi:hypothetical protein
LKNKFTLKSFIELIILALLTIITVFVASKLTEHSREETKPQIIYGQTIPHETEPEAIELKKTNSQ